MTNITAPGPFSQAPVLLAKGSSGRSGGSSSRSSSSSKSSSGSKSSGSSKSSGTSTAPKTGTSTAKPGSTVKTSDGKTITSSGAAPKNAKYSQSSGVVGDNGYQPKFNNGYNAPPGSVVYYPQHSAMDWLPWVYLFSQDSPRNDSVTVVQPDGREVEAKPEDQGFDGLALFNWIVLVVIAVAVIAGVVWLVHKLTTRVNR